MWVNNVIRPTFLVMMFCRVSHEGDCFLHMKTAEAMFPYMFVAHEYNYGILCPIHDMARAGDSREVLSRIGISDMFSETNWMIKGHGHEIIKLRHKKVYPSRIQRDVRDRISHIRATLQSCIDPLILFPTKQELCSKYQVVR